MKRIVFLLMMVCMLHLSNAQTKVEKTIPVRQGQKISMDFTWPELISIRTWDRSEIKIIASVEINKGQNDDAFMIEVEDVSNGLNISTFIKDLKNLPRKIVFYRGDEEYFFNTDDMNSPEIQKFKSELGDQSFQTMTHGVIKDIALEIYIPTNLNLDVYSKFGLVEVFGYDGSMKIHSKFGGVDVSTNGQNAISAGTKFGEKYTNLNGPVKTVELGSRPGKWDWVLIGSKQNSTHQELKSDFGNIYIRKN